MSLRVPALSAAAVLAFAASAQAVDLRATLPTGQAITPTAAPGALFQPLSPDLADLPGFVAGQASAVALSPDGRTLLILTSGFNRNAGADGKPVPAWSGEYVFVYDVSGAAPVKRQVLSVADSFLGLAWAPDGRGFYVSGGVDDAVIAFGAGPTGAFAQTAKFPLTHKPGPANASKPVAAGLAVSPDGTRVLVANVQNDSVSLIDVATGAVAEFDLRPGGGKPGGTFPRAVAWTSNTRAYVAAARDREIIRLDVAGDAVKVAARIRTDGQPSALLAAAHGAKLYAALDNTDGVAVIDTARDRIIAHVSTAGPGAPKGPKLGGPKLGGAGSNALALSPDGRTLYVSNGGENAVAVVKLGAGKTKREVGPRTVGLIPTGWYPTAVAVSHDGRRLYAVNGKSNPGPNPLACRPGDLPEAKTQCRAANQYVWQLEKAGFLTLPTPTAATLAGLTRQVGRNNHTGPEGRAEDAATMAFLRGRIHHVLYIVKENRTYDQVLGDLGRGDGDPSLELFPESIAPNHHKIARQFVDLDAFRDSGESSNTGWNWSTAGRTNDWTEREAPVNYAKRGLEYDQEGTNRDVNVGLATAAARHAARAKTPHDPDLLPGTADVAAPDGPDGDEGQGYLWDSARRAGVSMRNWGFYGDLSRYDEGEPDQIPRDHEPWKTGRRVFFTTKPALAKITDPYFRGFDQSFPDYWRFQEWKREFDAFSRKGSAPKLMMLRLAKDHFGSFKQAIDGVDTVETEMADNDYALGLTLETLSKSPFAKDTLVFVVEDDAQDGADHVDAHRSIAFVVGPYVKPGAVVSAAYTTVDMLRTIEDVLGVKPMGLNDARARPMTQVFDRSVTTWSYIAVVPPALRSTRLPLPPPTAAEAAPPKLHTSDYWAKAMAGQDFSTEDKLDTAKFNAALWRGLKGEDAVASVPGTGGGR